MAMHSPAVETVSTKNTKPAYAGWGGAFRESTEVDFVYLLGAN